MANRRKKQNAEETPANEERAQRRPVRPTSGRDRRPPSELPNRGQAPDGVEAPKSANLGVHHEAVAVVLWCVGLLSLLSLWSYDAGDASLNASGSAEIQNWIGPAGAYWADLLLQTLGVGAFVLAAATLLAGCRAFLGRRIIPRFREAAGSLLLMGASGTFAHLLFMHEGASYPAGGVAGALLADMLLKYFANVGAYIVAGGLVCLSVVLTTNGVLVGLGFKGMNVVRWVGLRFAAAWVLVRERRRQLAERRAALQGLPEHAPSADWTLGDPQPLRDEQAGDTRVRTLKRAKDRGRELGDVDADKEAERARRAALKDRSEPDIQLDKTLDLEAEAAFELGDIPVIDTVAKLEGIDADAPQDPVSPAKAGPNAAKEPSSDGASKPACEMSRPAAATARKTATGEPEIVDVRPEVDLKAIEAAVREQAKQEKAAKDRRYQLPSPTLLDFQVSPRGPVDRERLKENAQRLIKTLKDYGIEGAIREIRPGPVITMYEFVPARGTKISKIANLADDLAMSMEALRVRIVAPIPGKGAVGIEIPNDEVETVYLKELITHDAYRKSKAKLPLALGKNIEGVPSVADLARMPHLLVAGATGAGKSVSINGMIMSLLFHATPDDVRLIMVDPKMLELSSYDGIPHLLLPVVTDPKKAALALRWAVEEMERRYQLLSGLGVRNLAGYNAKIKAAAKSGEELTVTVQDKAGNPQVQVCEHLPFLVVIVDELADLMMVASRDVEASIMRLAQMARAAGIHLVLATQRPSVDVLTGVIKANFPTRVAFQVASKHDSRTILDMVGAEHLLGRGDMLFLSPGTMGVSRLHGCFVSESEIERTVQFLKEQGEPEYDETILAQRDDDGGGEAAEEERDEVYDQAIAIVAETRQASISMIQRRLRIGYNRAARIVEQMEREGIVGPGDGAKPREVLIPSLPE